MQNFFYCHQGSVGHFPVCQKWQWQSQKVLVGGPCLNSVLNGQQTQALPHQLAHTEGRCEQRLYLATQQSGDLSANVLFTAYRKHPSCQSTSKTMSWKLILSPKQVAAPHPVSLPAPLKIKKGDIVVPLWFVAGGLSGLFDVSEREWRREGWTVTCSDISHPSPSGLEKDGPGNDWWMIFIYRSDEGKLRGCVPNLALVNHKHSALFKVWLAFYLDFFFWWTTHFTEK